MVCVATDLQTYTTAHVPAIHMGLIFPIFWVSITVMIASHPGPSSLSRLLRRIGFHFLQTLVVAGSYLVGERRSIGELHFQYRAFASDHAHRSSSAPSPKSRSLTGPGLLIHSFVISPRSEADAQTPSSHRTGCLATHYPLRPSSLLVLCRYHPRRSTPSPPWIFAPYATRICR